MFLLSFFFSNGMIFDFSMDFRVGILFSTEVHWSPFTITPGSPSIGRPVSMRSSSSESTGGLFLGGGRVRGGLIMLAHLDDGNGSRNSTSCLNITLLKSQVLWTDLALWKCLFWQGLPNCNLFRSCWRPRLTTPCLLQTPGEFGLFVYLPSLSWLCHACPASSGAGTAMVL